MEEFIRTYPLCRYIHARNGMLVKAMNRRKKESGVSFIRTITINLSQARHNIKTKIMSTICQK